MFTVDKLPRAARVIPVRNIATSVSPEVGHFVEAFAMFHHVDEAGLVIPSPHDSGSRTALHRPAGSVRAQQVAIPLMTADQGVQHRNIDQSTPAHQARRHAQIEYWEGPLVAGSGRGGQTKRTERRPPPILDPEPFSSPSMTTGDSDPLPERRGRRDGNPKAPCVTPPSARGARDHPTDLFNKNPHDSRIPWPPEAEHIERPSPPPVPCLTRPRLHRPLGFRKVSTGMKLYTLTDDRGNGGGCTSELSLGHTLHTSPMLAGASTDTRSHAKPREMIGAPLSWDPDLCTNHASPGWGRGEGRKGGGGYPRARSLSDTPKPAIRKLASGGAAWRAAEEEGGPPAEPSRSRAISARDFVIGGIAPRQPSHDRASSTAPTLSSAPFHDRDPIAGGSRQPTKSLRPTVPAIPRCSKALPRGWIITSPDQVAPDSPCAITYITAGPPQRTNPPPPRYDA